MLLGGQAVERGVWAYDIGIIKLPKNIGDPEEVATRLTVMMLTLVAEQAGPEWLGHCWVDFGAMGDEQTVPTFRLRTSQKPVGSSLVSLIAAAGYLIPIGKIMAEQPQVTLSIITGEAQRKLYLAELKGQVQTAPPASSEPRTVKMPYEISAHQRQGPSTTHRDRTVFGYQTKVYEFAKAHIKG